MGVHYLVVVDRHLQIRSDLTAAMKARDDDTVRTLRSLLAAIGNAAAVEPETEESEVSLGAFSSETPRHEVTSVDVDRIIDTEISERREALILYQDAGRPDITNRMEHEIRVLSRYSRGK